MTLIWLPVDLLIAKAYATLHQIQVHNQMIDYVFRLFYFLVLLVSFLPLLFLLAIVKKLQHVYHTAIKPLEEAYKYKELRQHEVSGEHLAPLLQL